MNAQERIYDLIATIKVRCPGLELCESWQLIPGQYAARWTRGDCNIMVSTPDDAEVFLVCSDPPHGRGRSQYLFINDTIEAIVEFSGTRNSSHRHTVILDFDGVLHSYTSGWLGAEVIPDPPVAGAVDFCDELVEHYRVMVISTRCSQPGGAYAIMAWLFNNGFSNRVEVSPDGKKVPAVLAIDDRAIQFSGTFPSIEFIKAFKPWTSAVLVDPVHPCVADDAERVIDSIVSSAERRIIGLIRNTS